MSSLTGLDNCVKFEWNIIYSCNFRCPHCVFDGKWEEYGKKTVYRPVEEWAAIWKDVSDRYGAGHLLITGGEPFLYPGFIDIVSRISRFHRLIDICTNGSGDIKQVIKFLDPEKVRPILSFQPDFNKLEDIVEKNKALKQAGFMGSLINLCAYPGYLPGLPAYKAEVERLGWEFDLVPFYGRYEGRKYPDAYTEQERAMLGFDAAWEKKVRRKGSMCRAGQTSVLIFPDGKLGRCGQIGERFPLGNIFEGGLKLLNEPMECDAELCPCLEGQLVADN